MTQIKKILDKQGNDIYLRTHTKAVVDDNGYTAESRLQAMQDEINQKQLAVGAVPSDLTPTENSTNWVTSGGLYNQLNIGEANVEIDLTEYEEVAGYILSDNKWHTGTAMAKGKFIPVVGGQRYKIVAQDSVGSYYAFLTSNTVGSNNSNVTTYATGSTYTSLHSGTSIIETAPDNAKYLWIFTTYQVTGDRAPDSVVIYNKKSVLEVINNNDDVPIEGSENLITSGAVYNSLYTQEEIGLSSLELTNFYVNANNVWANSQNAGGKFLPVTKGEVYKLQSTVGVVISVVKSTNQTANAAPDFSTSYPQRIIISPSTVYTVEIPADAHYVWIKTKDSGNDITPVVVKIKEKFASATDVENLSRKELDMEFGFISSTGNYTGYNSPMSGENYDWNYWRNTGMVRVKSGANYTIDTDVDATYIRFYWYDENRTYINNSTVFSPSLGTDGLYHATAKAQGDFLRVVILYDSQYRPKVYVNGVLDENTWYAYLGGYIPYGSVMNFVTDTYYQTLNSDIAETTTVQDTGYKLINRGLLKLPTNYDPDGEPSRLVIYCHGADGFKNWSNSTTSFDVDHIDPTIWINSGYAVMDMDDLTRTEYLQGQDVPTLLTQNCYLRGYEHVLKNYNIRKDGVILCGRSLGGQRVMMLLNSQLPILCCCLIAPSCGFSRYWNMKDRRRITTVYNNFPTTIEVNGVETEINWGSTAEISDIEWAAMQKYYRLVLNTHGILKLLCVPKSDFFATHTIDGVEVSLRSNPETWDRIVFTNWVGKTKIPIKVWYAKDDDILTDPTRHQDLLYNIVNNGGGLCEYHIFATGGHYPERDGAKVTYTNKYGVTYENTSLVYAEMLQFIRRYEQDN